MSIDLDAIEARAAAATPGPWEARDLSDAHYNSKNGKGWWWVWRAGCPNYAGVAEMDGKFIDDNGQPIPGALAMACITDGDDGEHERADATFIAHARTDIPDLVRELRETEHLLAIAVQEAVQARDEVIERLRQFNIAKDQRDRAEAERDELRAEVERLCADVSDSSRLIWKQAQLLTDVVNAVRGEPGRLELHSHHDAPELVKAVVAERDALSARLQAVRVLADEGEHECSEACELFNCDANRRYLVAKDRILDALDASLGTPGDEKPQATKRRAAAGGTRLVALMQAATAIRNHRNEERRPEVAGLNAAAEIIDQMIRDGEGFPIGPLGVAPTPIKPLESSGSAE